MNEEKKVQKWLDKYEKETSEVEVSKALECDGIAVTKVIVRIVADPAKNLHFAVCNNWFRRVRTLCQKLTRSGFPEFGAYGSKGPVWVLLRRHFDGEMSEAGLNERIADGMIAYTSKVVDMTPRHMLGSFH